MTVTGHMSRKSLLEGREDKALLMSFFSETHLLVQQAGRARRAHMQLESLNAEPPYLEGN